MKHQLFAILGIAASIHLQAQTLPQKIVATEVTTQENVLLLDSTNLPLLYQLETRTEKQLDPVTYFTSLQEHHFPQRYSDAYHTLRASNNEFDKRDALAALMPILYAARASTEGVTDVLVPVQVELGQYDFNTRAFPLKVIVPDVYAQNRPGYPPNTNFGAYCAGGLWKEQGPLGVVVNLPCVSIRAVGGIVKQAFAHLTVSNEAIARTIKQRKEEDQLEPYILAKLIPESQFNAVALESLNTARLRVLLAEPQALFLYDARSKQMLAAAEPLRLPPYRAASAASRTPTNGVIEQTRNSSASKGILETVPVTKPTINRNGAGKRAPVSLSVE